MAAPYFMPLVDIVIQRVSASQPVDADFRSPSSGGSKRYSTAITRQGMIKWEQFKYNNPTVSGNAELADGHITFRKDDIESDSLKRGDKVTSVDGRSVSIYLLDIAPVAHSNVHAAGSAITYRCPFTKDPHVLGAVQ